jgi:hypothetical protein
MSESQHSDPPADSGPGENAASPADGKNPPAIEPRPAQEPRQGDRASAAAEQAESEQGKEVGGPAGPEPTRYGDWERKGRCIDF